MDASKALSRRQTANLRLRVASATVGIIAIVGTLLAGDVWFALAVVGIIVLALNEFYALLRQCHHKPNEVLGLAAGAAFPVAALVGGPAGMATVLFALALTALLWYLVFSKTSLVDIAITVLGAVYVGYLLSYLVLIRGLHKGVWLVLLVLVATWINDIVAYAAGTTLGAIKLAPQVSPGKTVEGTLAGVFAASAALGAMTFISYLDTLERLILGALAAAAATAGDLAESRLKRELGVKDSGKLVPGHGGFLDRFDSLLFVSGASYYALTTLFKLR